MSPKKKSEVLTINRTIEKPITHWLSTGCTLLDLAIANRLPGGFPAGRVSHVYGWESSAKTVLGQEPLGSAQRQNGLIWFLDAEQTLDWKRAKDLFGIDTDSDTFHYGVPESIEKLFDFYLHGALKEIVKREKYTCPNALALDSLSALPSEAELNQELVENTYGMTRAKQISTSYRKYLLAINDANLALIMINQARTKVSPMAFGDKMTVSGGKALDFYASVSVCMKNVGKIGNSKKQCIGNIFEFKIVKNKVAPPYRKGQLYLIYDYGIDDVRTSIHWLKDIRETTSYEINNQSFKSINDAIAYVEGENLEEALRNEVVTVWNDIYKPEDRKPKVRV